MTQVVFLIADALMQLGEFVTMIGTLYMLAITCYHQGGDTPRYHAEHHVLKTLLFHHLSGL